MGPQQHPSEARCGGVRGWTRSTGSAWRVRHPRVTEAPDEPRLREAVNRSIWVAHGRRRGPGDWRWNPCRDGFRSAGGSVPPRRFALARFLHGLAATCDTQAPGTDLAPATSRVDRRISGIRRSIFNAENRSRRRQPVQSAGHDIGAAPSTPEKIRGYLTAFLELSR